MFIAMNRFRIVLGKEADFQRVWTERDSHLQDVPGFVEFHLLRGPTTEEHTLFASHTIWASRKAFEDWTRSENFRRAHAGAGSSTPLYLGHPQFEGFEVVQEVLGKPAG
jgi:heme-degrading monooxygenase HmoA